MEMPQQQSDCVLVPVTYVIEFKDEFITFVSATNAADALDLALDGEIENFIATWRSRVKSVSLYEPEVAPLSRLCAVDQNEVVCAHPGCTGPYHCKERGLQE